MHRFTLGRNSRLAALLVAAVLGLALAATASADTPPGRGPNGGPPPTPTPTTRGGECAVLRVQLNGNQPATQTCVASAPAAQGTGSLATAGVYKDDCSSDDVVLYEDRYYGGKKICFAGFGIANLSNYMRSPGSWWDYRTWDDRVSSLYTGHHNVALYEHPNAGGSWLKLYWGVYYPNLGSFWNDRVSSICLPDYSTFVCP